MERVLVTGGAGFIGANFCRFLIDHTDASLTVLDKMTYAAAPEALAPLPAGRISVVVGDIADPDLVGRLVGDHDTVVNFAAESHNDTALSDAGSFVATNLVGTYVLVEAATRAGCRLHHVSTDEVYGDLALDEQQRFTESSPYRPSSPYAATKAGADHLVRAWVRSRGLRATISHCSNNLGPWQHVEKFLPRQITNLLDGRRPRLYGDGRHVRDWIHVEDHSSAVWTILDRGRIGETYVIGADGEHSNRDLVGVLLAAFDRPPDDVDFVADRPGHDLRYALDATKLRTELGWIPQRTDLARELSALIDWYRDHESWWRPAKAATEAAYAARGQ